MMMMPNYPPGQQPQWHEIPPEEVDVEVEDVEDTTNE